MNKIIIVGNLGQDPEMRYSQSGQARTTFRVASNRRDTSRGEQREETQWFGVTAWDQLAEICNKILGKGYLVLVEGRVKAREYTDRNGEKQLSMDVTATDIQLLRGPAGDRRNGEDQGSSENPEHAQDEERDEGPEDIPFV